MRIFYAMAMANWVGRPDLEGDFNHPDSRIQDATALLVLEEMQRRAAIASLKPSDGLWICSVAEELADGNLKWDSFTGKTPCDAISRMWKKLHGGGS